MCWVLLKALQVIRCISFIMPCNFLYLVLIFFLNFCVLVNFSEASISFWVPWCLTSSQQSLKFYLYLEFWWVVNFHTAVSSCDKASEFFVTTSGESNHSGIFCCLKIWEMYQTVWPRLYVLGLHKNRHSVFYSKCDTKKIKPWWAGMAWWWEHLPPTTVARDQFPAITFFLQD